MKPSPSSEHDEQDRELIELLKDLGSIKAEYPSELLAARRAAFLARVNELTTADEELTAEDQEIVQLLGRLRAAPVEYPPELLAARRSAFLSQMERARGTSILDKLRIAVQRMFSSEGTLPNSSPAGLMRISLVIASLIAAVWVGSLFLRDRESAVPFLPLQPAAAPTVLMPTTGEVAILICQPEDQSPSCPSAESDPSNDLADPENGMAHPAVSKDARPSQDGAHKAAYVNDGRKGASWVSDSADSWIKIDLGEARTINTVSLQKGNLGSSADDTPGQFVISVALSDVYSDGDSSNDSMEYEQVFQSEQTGFSGTVSHAETIHTKFPPVTARFVKITFEKAGVAIEEVGVFMVQPPELAEQPTTIPPVDAPEFTLTPTATGVLLAVDTATDVPSVTWLPTDTAVLVPTATPSALPTNTLPPEVTSTLVLINPVPSNTPIPLPTVVPPTAIPATIQATPASTGPIRVSGNNQTLTFTCNGNAAEIRGHSNTITLLGSCSSITVAGNGNRVFWESGSPVITIKGKDNIVEQL